MNISRQHLADLLVSAANLLAENTAYLSQIDSRFGDGDHGVTIGKIADLIQKEVSAWGEAPIKKFIENLGANIMAVSGGSAGPLYGTMIGGLAEGLDPDATEIDGPMLKKMLDASLSEMEDITTAKVGDKTMMDAFIPAVEAVRSAPDDTEPIRLLTLAAEAADQGAKASEGFASKFGRAKSYREQTIGTPDAGAVSTALLFTGLAVGAARL